MSDDTATPSDATEPTECAHKCSEESGCIKKELDCQHEHTEDCGYVPATEGTPCGFVCEECNPVDSGTNPAYPAEKPETECICKTLCTEEERNADCLVCGAEGADLTLCKGVEPETDTPSNAAQLSVGDVQKLIDELPTADELAAMTPEEQQAVYTKVQAAYEAYNALTDEQKAEVTGAEIFEELFAAFNSMVNALEENTGGFTVTGGMYGVDYTYNEADGKLYILTSTKLTITTNGKATSSMIWGTRNI